MRSADRPAPRQPVPRDTSQRGDEEAAAVFSAAMAGFQEGLERQSALRAEFTFEDMPPPKRLAPHATATAATVSREGADVAWGRLVLLYDPAGPEGWHGCYRLISYLRAEIDPEIAADPMLGQVGWSWLIEALDACTPGYAAPSGTVTRVTTEGFGGKADEEPVHGYEQRASWSPAPAGMDMAGPGVRAAPDDPETLAAAAGLPPLAIGTLPRPRRTAEQSRRRR
jgi:hypothetical protein